MKQPRRLGPATEDPYSKARRAPLRSFTLSEGEYRELEAEHPKRVIVKGEAILVAQARHGAISLQYAFPDRDAFSRQFPSMLEHLLPAVNQEDAPLGFRLRVTDASSRPFLEPVLFAQAFALLREWMRMTLLELPEGSRPDDRLPPGFTLRPARPEDAEAIAELDEAAFPTSVLTPETARDLMGSTPLLRMLEDMQAKRAVGFLRLRPDRPGEGYVSDIAIHPDYQRRGLGEATMRWALDWFRTEGLHRAALTVSVDNGAAIALYRKLGFVPDETGIDYRRPIDEDEVRQLLEQHRAQHISVRNRY